MRFSVRHVRKAWALCRARGATFFWYLLAGWLCPRVGYYLVYRVRRRRLKLMILTSGVLALMSLAVALAAMSSLILGIGAAFVVVALLWVGRTARHKLLLNTWRRQARSLTEHARAVGNDDLFTSWSRWPVDEQVRRAVEAARQSELLQELVIGSIDGDGRVLGKFGKLPGLPEVSSADFEPRKRTDLDIVLIDDFVLVRKGFRRDERAFVGEWLGLASLAGTANVPALHHVDARRRVLYKNLVPGKTVREILVERGARILLAQTREDPEMSGLDEGARLRAIVARGTSLIPRCLPDGLLSQIESQLDIFHGRGVTGVSTTFGNVVVDQQTEDPWFIDLDGARFSSPGSFLHDIRRDQDRVKFNTQYGRHLLTEETARHLLAEMLGKTSGWYAPLDFGNGLTVGGFWSVESGTGRWEYLNKAALTPLIQGKRILDLGSNNGAMPLMMLRAGAREVVGVELSRDFAAAAALVHQIFEWRDMRKYSFQLHNCDMLNILREDWGLFDVVTAYCSLYYLSRQDMARIIRRASALAPVVILQANTATRREAAEEKAEKSSSRFLQKLLEDNGFPSVEVFSHAGYGRPLLVGRVASQSNRPGQLALTAGIG